MALEYCPNGDFFDFIQKSGGIKDLKLLKFLFLQVCRGVDALHTTSRMAHLDIKLENILVSESGDLKLCDFGMVRPVAGDNSQKLGTDMYMAPEVADKDFNETYKGIPADIFSLGSLLWVMFFGQPPFAKASKYDRNYAIM